MPTRALAALCPIGGGPAAGKVRAGFAVGKDGPGLGLHDAARMPIFTSYFGLRRTKKRSDIAGVHCSRSMLRKARAPHRMIMV